MTKSQLTATPPPVSEAAPGAWSSEELLHAVVSASPVAIYVVDAEGIVHLWNEAAERLFGWAAAEALGRRLPIVSGEDSADFDRLRGEALAGRGFVGLERVRNHRDGHGMFLSISTVPLRDPSGRVRAVLGMSEDISARKEAEAALLRQARFDPLTGLNSRTRFMELLGDAVSQPGARALLVYLDLDAFKDVNDGYGHAVGDELLAAYADRLRNAAGERDVIARTGGDEFAVLVRDVGPGEVAGALRELGRTMAAPVVIGGREITVRASGGVAMVEHPMTTEEAMRAADIAMYEAKRTGSGFRVFDSTMHEAVLERVELEAELARAVDRGQLVVHYQPVVDLSDGRLRGFEALVRWAHPERGLLAPGRFIALAEGSDTIIPLGRWVLREALSQLGAWQRRFPEAGRLTMSVNLSPRQLRDPQLVDDVLEAVGGAGVEPELLQLEMTETVLADQGAEGVLARLGEAGVSLAIDDFGTGFSSLTALRRFSFDTLKLDRSFVAGVDTSAEDRAIVLATLGLARALGLRTVAEGVETPGQLEMLAGFECHAAQGYLISRPKSAEEMTAILAAGAHLVPGPRPGGTPGGTDMASSAEDLARRDPGEWREVAGLVRPLLDELKRTCGMDAVYVTRIEWAEDRQRVVCAAGGTDDLGLREGLEVAWEDALCRKSLASGRVFSGDVATDFPDCGFADHLGITSFVTSPVVLADGSVFGTVCAADRRRRPDAEGMAVLLSLTARMIASALGGP